MHEESCLGIGTIILCVEYLRARKPRPSRFAPCEFKWTVMAFGRESISWVSSAFTVVSKGYIEDNTVLYDVHDPTLLLLGSMGAATLFGVILRRRVVFCGQTTATGIQRVVLGVGSVWEN